MKITLPIHNIEITLGPPYTEVSAAFAGGTISSDLHENTDPQADAPYIAAVNAVESIVLAHAVSGIDVKSPAYLEGIETALDAISNNCDDSPSLGPWEEHPEWDRSDWRQDVANGDTNLGYADWVRHQIESAEPIGSVDD